MVKDNKEHKIFKIKLEENIGYLTHQVQTSMDFQVDPLTQVQTPLKTLGWQSTAQRLIPSLSRTSKYAAYQNLLIE